MKLSFIIVNYRSFEYLNNCLKSILEKSIGIDFEIILVNNDKNKIGSIDCIDEKHTEKLTLGQYGKEKGENDKKLKIIEINKNIGFGKANNIGFFASKGEVICFLNPDTEIISNNLNELLNKFKNDSKIGIIGPQIIEKNGAVQSWSAGVDLELSEILRGKTGLSKSRKIWESNNEMEADWVSGAGMFVKRGFFGEVGGFDEDFFLYYEDLDLCKRVKKGGKMVIFYPEFKILHLGGKSAKNKIIQKKEYFKSQDLYYKKWFKGYNLGFLKFLRFFYAWRYYGN